jgi:hypothetical protein
MWKLAVTVFALTLVQPSLGLASGGPTDVSAKSSSFVPHGQGHRHTYGSPIQPAIVGHSSTHQKPKPMTRSSGNALRNAQ